MEPGEATESTSRDSVLWWHVLLIGIAGATVAWARVPEAARNSLWGEDGRVFLSDAVSHGFWQSLFVPYAGYQQFAPRVVAGFVAAVVPVTSWAVAMTAAACLLTGAVVAAIFTLSRDVVPWLPARIGIALTPVLVASVDFELSGNMADFHSMVMCLGPWLFLHRPSSRWSAVVWGVVALCATLTEVQLVFFLPLWLWRMRDRRRVFVRCGVLLGGLVGAVSDYFVPRHLALLGAFDLHSTILGFFANAVLATVVNSTTRIGEIIAFHRWIIWIAAVLLVAALVACLILGTSSTRIAAVALATASIAVWVLGYNANSPTQFPYGEYGAQEWVSWAVLVRYGIVPGIFLTQIVVLAAMCLYQRGVSWGAITVLALCGTVLVAQIVPTQVRRASGPEWDVRAGVEYCNAHPNAQYASVPEAPSGWNMAIPCDLLRTG